MGTEDTFGPVTCGGRTTSDELDNLMLEQRAALLLVNLDLLDRAGALLHTLEECLRERDD